MFCHPHIVHYVHKFKYILQCSVLIKTLQF